MAAVPQVCYAMNGDLHIAHQVLGRAMVEALTARIEEVIALSRARWLSSWCRGPSTSQGQAVRRQEQIWDHRQGNPWLASALGEAGISTSRIKTFLDRATTAWPAAAANSVPW